MSCLNENEQCCFDETGCIYNDSCNTCMAEKWQSYFNPMPVEDNPTLDKLKRRLSKWYNGEVIINFQRKSILGKIYDILVMPMFQPMISYELIINNDGIFYMKGNKLE